MGCASSKLDDLPAVALCRERCAHLDEAIQQRYTLAEAHVGYLHSLRAVGICLHRFFDQDLDNSPPSPVINLPTQRKGDPQPSGSPPQKAAAIDNSRNHHHDDHHHRHSHSNSGSHLNFHTDSDSDDSESESHLHLHSESNSPVHVYGQMNYGGQINYGDQEPMNSMYPGVGFMGMNMNYMRNSATPSVIYEQRPMSSETVRMGESSASYYPPPYDNPNPNPNPYYNHQGYGGGPPGYGGGGGGGRGFFSAPQPYGSSSYPPPPAGPSGAASMEASTSKPPPPPPSPPRTSGWDFLNPFESFESYYPPYTPSRDSREVREEEGIPDLEEVDDFQHEVVKEVDMNQKFGDSGGGGGSSGAAAAKNYSKGVVIDEQHHHHAGKAADSDTLYDNNNARQSASVDSEPVEYEVHVVDKKVVDKEEKSGDRGNVAAFKASADSEVVREIQVQFERASESGTELAKMLEVGKFPYKRKQHSHVSSKMLNVMTPSLPIVSSLPSTSASIEADPAFLDNENVAMRSGNLSSTLQKLYLWEKKLYEEVKVEEKMRVLHERKSIRLKRLDEKGAETHKIDATRTLVRSLSTKIRIAIQVVDKISVKINTLRDEELWPQMNEFVQGLTRMWKAMYECHHTQCQAIAQAKRLDAVASGKHFSDAHLEATLQLEQELLNWTFRFSSWIHSQKGYVRALNNWLLKCLLYVPEETPDGIVPFSPGRIGAPPIFVICNQWSQALDRISEKEVVEALRDFATSVLQLWERDKVEMRHRMMGGKDMERKVKYLEREDQKIHKELQALDKRIVLISGDGNGLSLSGHVVFQSDTRSSSLQVNLQHIFEAMDRFTANSSKAYEELVQRIEEDRLDRLSREDESS